jgi:hypothetical protein
VNPGSRCLGACHNLVGNQVLISAIENLDNGLASSGYALVLVTKQA